MPPIPPDAARVGPPVGTSVFRCDWCGRFYTSSLPEGSSCFAHIPEHNARLSVEIARFNARLKERTDAQD